MRPISLPPGTVTSPDPLRGAVAEYPSSPAFSRPTPLDHGPIVVSEIVERDSFMLLEGEWDSLAQATHDEPFYRHEFFRVWLDNFAPTANWLILIGRNTEGQLVAAMPLLYRTAPFMGVPSRQIVSAANDHTPRFSMLALSPEPASAAFFRHLSARRDWDVLLLRDVPPDGSAWDLFSTAQKEGRPTGTWDSLLSPYIALPSTVEALEKGLNSKFRANLRRRMKKLEEHGEVTLERTTGGIMLEEKLEEGYALEASGWKGRGGTAIVQDWATRGFYSELARTARYSGYLSLYTLRVGGEAAAFHYGLLYNDRYYLLKPAYSEAVRECSPGHLLMHAVMRDLISRGVTEFDFLGPDMEWKRDWSGANARQHTWLFVFNGTAKGRFLHTLKFKWAHTIVRAAKNRLRRSDEEAISSRTES